MCASYTKGEKSGGKVKLNAKILQNRKRKLTGVPGRPDFPDGPGSPGLPWDAKLKKQEEEKKIQWKKTDEEGQ